MPRNEVFRKDAEIWGAVGERGGKRLEAGKCPSVPDRLDSRDLLSAFAPPGYINLTRDWGEAPGRGGGGRGDSPPPSRRPAAPLGLDLPEKTGSARRRRGRRAPPAPRGPEAGPAARPAPAAPSARGGPREAAVPAPCARWPRPLRPPARTRPAGAAGAAGLGGGAASRPSLQVRGSRVSCLSVFLSHGRLPDCLANISIRLS